MGTESKPSLAWPVKLFFFACKFWPISLVSLFIPTVLPSSPSSPSCWAHREWMYGRYDAEDHRFRAGQRMAQDHQDEHSGDLRLDGPRSHQVLNLLQGQRRLEVSARVCQRVQKAKSWNFLCALVAFMSSQKPALTLICITERLESQHLTDKAFGFLLHVCLVWN